MSHMLPLAISKHAVDQFRTRWAPDLSEQEARDQLDRLAREAHVVRSYPDGDQIFRSRKSWWVPGSHSRWGGAAWLRHYYPSLYQQLAAWMPDAGAYT